MMHSPKHFSLLTMAIFSVLAISNKSTPSINAHFLEDSASGSTDRVSFNEQVANSLRTASRAQQAYYFERGKFADNGEELMESGFSLVSDDFYQLETDKKENIAFIHGIPQQNYAAYKQWNGSGWKDAKEPLYSYISAIAFLAENSSFQSILCVSKTIGEGKIAESEIVEGKFICSQNAEKLS